MISKINGEESIKTAIVDETEWELAEEIKNCTVQILKNKNGDYSIGWWRNE